MSSIQPGLTHTFEKVSEPRESAAAVASGALDVFSTPSMVALFEAAALQVVEPLLDAGQTTVGIEVAVKHLKATRIGKKVRATVTLTGVEGRKLTYTGEMHDEDGKIGEGTHTRFIVDAEKFLARI